MTNKARAETMKGSEQSHLGQHPSGQVVFPSHTSWPIYKASILPEPSGTRPILQVDISHISTDWPQNLTNEQELGDTEWEEKRELDTRPPLKRDLSLKKRDFVIQFLKDAKPETLEKFFNLAVEEAGAVPTDLDASKAAPTTPPRPADEPPLWAERTTGREVSPVDWIKMHYGNKDPKNWQAMGLTRDVLRRIDRPLYQAFGTFFSRLRKSPDSIIPAELEPLLESPSDRAAAELLEEKISSPEDTKRLVSIDPVKAERLRGAIRRRL